MMNKICLFFYLYQELLCLQWIKLTRTAYPHVTYDTKLRIGIKYVFYVSHPDTPFVTLWKSKCYTHYTMLVHHFVYHMNSIMRKYISLVRSCYGNVSVCITNPLWGDPPITWSSDVFLMLIWTKYWINNHTKANLVPSTQGKISLTSLFLQSHSIFSSHKSKHWAPDNWNQSIEPS